MGFARKDYIVRNSDRGWDVIRGGDRLPTARMKTRQAAVARASRLSRSAGGEVRVLGRSGKIVRGNSGGSAK